MFLVRLKLITIMTSVTLQWTASNMFVLFMGSVFILLILFWFFRFIIYVWKSWWYQPKLIVEHVNVGSQPVDYTPSAAQYNESEYYPEHNLHHRPQQQQYYEDDDGQVEY